MQQQGNDCAVCDPFTSTTSWANKADGLACSSDGLSCTVDACKAGACTHALSTSACLIAGTCYKHADGNPANACEFCNAATSPKAWAARQDGVACTGDSLACTSDVCHKGVCEHVVASGCLINNQCVAEGNEDPQNGCLECVSQESTSSWTAVEGKGCGTGGGVARMCVSSTCRGWSESTFEPGQTQGTSLRAVAHIPPANQVWAAGAVTSNGSKGLLVNVGSTSSHVVTPSPLADLHHRLAVGSAGSAWYHDGSKWVAATPFSQALGGADRWSVWGRAAGATAESYYLTGQQTSSLAAILQCTLTTTGSSALGTVQCAAHQGVPGGDIVAWIFGIQAPGGGQGPLWGVAGGGSAPEDIFYNTGSGSSWSRSGPHGCLDSQGGSTPCSGTSWDSMALGR